METAIRSAIYAGVAAYFARRTFESTDVYGLVFHGFLCLLSLKQSYGELKLGLQLRRMPPGVRGWPIVGDLPTIFITYKGDVLAYQREKKKRFGPIYVSWLHIPLVSLTEPDDIQWLWMQDRKQNMDISWPPSIQALIGKDSVATATGDSHKKLRRLIEPFFTPLFTKKYISAMEETTEEMLSDWCSKGGFHPSTVFKAYSLQVFLRASFGHVDPTTVQKLSDSFVTLLSGFFSLTMDKRIPGSQFDRAMKAREWLLPAIGELMDDFRSKNPESSAKAKTTLTGQVLYAKDDDGQTLTRSEQLDSALTFIFAGHDTTYASISSMIYYLSQHPEVEQALVEEVSMLKRPFDFDEIKNTPILNAVMNESWRICPPINAGFRKSTTDLEYKGYFFPKGTTFQYNIYLPCTDDSLYKDARTQFKIQRFLPDDHKLADPEWRAFEKKTAAYLPVFGGGSHVCLGRAFGQLEVRIMLAALYSEYKVEVKNAKPIAMPMSTWTMDFSLSPRS